MKSTSLLDVECQEKSTVSVPDDMQSGEQGLQSVRNVSLIMSRGIRGTRDVTEEN